MTSSRTRYDVARGIDRALQGDVSPWKLCRPAAGWKIYTIAHDTSLKGSTPVIKSQKVSARHLPDTELQFELIVVPIIAGYYASEARLSVGAIDSLRILFHDMDMPTSVISCFLDNRVQFTSFPTESEDETTYFLNFRQWCLAWQSSTTTGKSRAVLLWMGGSWAKASIADWVQDYLEDVTPAQHHSPGVLAVLLCGRHVAESLAAMDEEAFKTERRLREVIQHGQLKDENELGKLSAKHSWLASRAIREKHRINAATDFLDYLAVQTPDPARNSALSLRKHDREALQLLTTSLSTQASKLCEESAMHLSTIYNLIAQRDQATNLAIAAASREIAVQSRNDQANSIAIAESSQKIAEETKRDSNAMKMIALVTMIYLPGTFIATCFSMGLFQWDAGASDVVNPRIWLYFLFTGVLTLFTIGGFAGWLWWQDRGVQKSRANRVEETAATRSNEKEQPVNQSETKVKSTDASHTTIQSAQGMDPVTVLPRGRNSVIAMSRSHDAHDDDFEVPWRRHENITEGGPEVFFADASTTSRS